MMLSGHAAEPATAMTIHESTKAKLSGWTQVPKIAPFCWTRICRTYCMRVVPAARCGRDDCRPVLRGKAPHEPPPPSCFRSQLTLPPTAQSPSLNQDPRELFLTCAMRHSEGGAGSQTAAECSAFVSAGERSNKNSDMAPARSLPGLHIPLSPSLSVASQHRDSCAPEGLDLVLLLHAAVLVPEPGPS